MELVNVIQTPAVVLVLVATLGAVVVVAVAGDVAVGVADFTGFIAAGAMTAVAVEFMGVLVAGVVANEVNVLSMLVPALVTDKIRSNPSIILFIFV